MYKCGFYLRKEGSEIFLEVYDFELLKKCIKNPDEFEKCCEDWALLYGIKPEIVASMVALWVIGSKARTEEELKRYAEKLGIGLQKLPKVQEQ